MIAALVGLSLIMAVVVGWLVRQTINVQPWLEQHQASAATMPSSPAPTGLGVFLTVATSFFTLFISAYFMRREGADWRPVALPTLLWFNTLALAAASLFFQRASSAALEMKVRPLKSGLLSGGIFSWVFLAGQILAWRQLNAEGYSLTANPSNAFFYVLTALHGLHLLGGLWVWARSMIKLQLGLAPGALSLSVRLCAVYWHFLLAVWLVLFAVLLMT